jgi:hypothetical protein
MGSLCPRELEANTSSIILHGPDVNITTTAWCEPSRLRNDAGFVGGWTVEVEVEVGLLLRGVR